MFSLKNNASKICITHLAAHLIDSGFKIIDTQFYSKHLSQFGTIEIQNKEYLKILELNNIKEDLYINKKLKKKFVNISNSYFFLKKIGSFSKQLFNLISREES